MPLWLLVAAGGAAGAVARYAVNVLVQARLDQPGWVATCVVNGLGSVCIGVLYARTTDPSLRALLGVGVLGGFTTFSTFGNDAVGMLGEGRPLLAGTYILGSVSAGLLGVVLGRVIAGGWG